MSKKKKIIISVVCLFAVAVIVLFIVQPYWPFLLAYYVMFWLAMAYEAVKGFFI